MKFVKRKSKVDVEWQDAILHFDIPFMTDFIKDSGIDINDGLAFGMAILEASLVGWDKIEDSETGKPLEVNEENKKQIINTLFTDEEMSEKIQTIIKGPLGNLVSGSAAS